MAEDRIMTALANASDDQIRKEIARRRRNHLEEEKTRIGELRKWVRVHVDELLEVLPDHSRTSCSDENPCNDERQCDRCVLLKIKELDYNEEWVPDIRFNKLTDEDVENRTQKLFSEDS